MTDDKKTLSDMPKISGDDPYRLIAIDASEKVSEIKLPPRTPLPYFGEGDYRLRIDKAGIIVGFRRFFVVETTIVQTTNPMSLPGTRRTWVVGVDGVGGHDAASFLNETLTVAERLELQELFQPTEQGVAFRDIVVKIHDFAHMVHVAAKKTIGREVMATFREMPTKNERRPFNYMRVYWTSCLEKTP